MVFTHTWNAAFEADPADTDQLSEGATRMRELRLAISERMEVDGMSWKANGLTDSSIRDRAVPAATKALFQQTTAPLLWTKDTTHNDKALRVVSGAASSGGTTAFSGISAVSVNGHAITTAEMPVHSHGPGTLATNSTGAHTHDIDTRNVAGSPDDGVAGAEAAAGSPLIAEGTARSAGNHSHSVTSGATANSGSGNTHDHVLGLDMAYVDIIIATKDAIST